MLLHLARSVETAIDAKWDKMKQNGEVDDLALDGTAEGLQIILLDGEEAFLRWTDDDSLYGAR